MAEGIKDEEARAQAITGLIEYLSDTLLSRALAAAWQIQDAYYRARALSSFLSVPERLTLTPGDWLKMLEVLAYLNRGGLINRLPHIRSLMLDFGDEQTFSDVLQVVRDVCRQWP